MSIRATNQLAAVGLALGGVFGMAGTFAPSAALRASAWAVDGAGLVMAAALLAMKFLGQERPIVASGFLVFAIGEGVMLSGAAAGLAASVPAFAAGTALWATALLMVSLPKAFPVVTRLVGISAAVLFAIVAGRIFWGEALTPTASPLPSYGYPVLVLTFAAWIWSLLREKTA